jgi:hypothetical protein
MNTENISKIQFKPSHKEPATKIITPIKDTRIIKMANLGRNESIPSKPIETNEITDMITLEKFEKI